ncbi:S-adenosyl-L-methionine-dependent methyltransferase [Clathrospora elynae]|uniref:S-adenosyl-L-methionine-dependent methyltransferase n=1 Tax=Clathrospora elynae TaxID=706981 RepID=A0A6A5S7I5_9PLEO|nr:S-adenosyl-L-methionine-dependent methyltransferase [Clathrospora elynae]
MPRIPTALVRKAHAIDAFLPALLAPCRDMHAAQNELRWLREHVDKVAKARRARGDVLAKGALLQKLVKQRASGKPLQYLLGTEYFGNLVIGCRPGVLIPRADTAASITHLVGLLRNAQSIPPELRILDLCTGTGCIPLLVQHELYSARKDVDLRVLGVDISSKALKLSNDNLQRLRKGRNYVDRGKVQFIKADVLIDPFTDQMEGSMSLKAALNYKSQPPFWDILISNPPYISPSAYWKTTARSVRGFEPKLALVPPPTAKKNDTEQGDMFYPRLLEIARDVEAKVVLLEVADVEQALRVAQHARHLGIFDGVEIWREQPDASTEDAIEDDFAIVGNGNARSVLCWRGAGTLWLGKSATIPQEDDAQCLFRASECHFYGGAVRPGGSSHLDAQFDRKAFFGFPETPTLKR